MDFQQLKPKIIQLAQADSALELLWLYGSYAQGTEHQNSDIDLAVIFKHWEEDPLERRLRPELLALEWQQQLNISENKLSLLDMGIAPIPIAMAVLKSNQLLVNKNTSRQLQEQRRIMSKWEIDYLYHYQHKQQLYG